MESRGIIMDLGPACGRYVVYRYGLVPCPENVSTFCDNCGVDVCAVHREEDLCTTCFNGWKPYVCSLSKKLKDEFREYCEMVLHSGASDIAEMRERFRELAQICSSEFQAGLTHGGRDMGTHVHMTLEWSGDEDVWRGAVGLVKRELDAALREEDFRMISQVESDHKFQVAILSKT